MKETSTKPEVKKAAEKPRKKKTHRNVPSGIVHVQSTFNNTIVSITDLAGNVVAWSSAGRAGYSGSRKSSAYAATVAGQKATREAMDMGMKEAVVLISGAGGGRESAVRGVVSAGMNVTMIEDVTPVAHNGCKPRKRRSV